MPASSHTRPVGPGLAVLAVGGVLALWVGGVLAFGAQTFHGDVRPVVCRVSGGVQNRLLGAVHREIAPGVAKTNGASSDFSSFDSPTLSHTSDSENKLWTIPRKIGITVCARMRCTCG